jgi:hypothetical protein
VNTAAIGVEGVVKGWVLNRLLVIVPVQHCLEISGFQINLFVATVPVRSDFDQLIDQIDNNFASPQGLHLHRTILVAIRLQLYLLLPTLMRLIHRYYMKEPYHTSIHWLRMVSRVAHGHPERIMYSY